MTKTLPNWTKKEPPRGFTVWLTGLPSSGKTTLGTLLAEDLERRGVEVELLDGDATRLTLSSGLGFSKEDRDENIRRIGFVCRLLSKHGVGVIAAAISPYRAVREEIRASITHFIEVYVKAPLQVCMERDPKGMYKKALTGEIRNFTGVSDPYEEPETAEVVVHTDREAPGDCMARILAKLQELGLVPPVRARAGKKGERGRVDVAKLA